MSYATLTVQNEFDLHEGKPTLRELQAAVGGYVEVVGTNQLFDVWVNEEGLLIGLDMNFGASVLTGRPLVGNVVFTGKPTPAGNISNLTQKAIKHLESLYAGD